MKKYTQLTLEEREQIHLMLWDKLSVRKMARELNRSPSSISREINRNTPPLHRRYTPHLAQAQYEARKRTVRQRPRLKDPSVVAYVREKMTKLNWSPEQIAGRWNKKHKTLKISHEAIYQYIYVSCKLGEEDDLRPFLRRKHKRRKRKYIPFEQREISTFNKVSIDLRPEVVNRRKQIGHWEGDTVESIRTSKVCLNTLNERVSKLVKISKMKNKTADLTARAVTSKLTVYPKALRRTLTLDNGTENAAHEKIAKQVGVKCYFAHAYHSWERGTNENSNGLIRYYFPKGTDFATVSKTELQRVEDLLNNRPRKCLNYQTPLEVFNKAVALTY